MASASRSPACSSAKPSTAWRGFSEPGADGLFLDACSAMDGCERAPPGQHGKALDDRLLVYCLPWKTVPLVLATTFLQV